VDPNDPRLEALARRLSGLTDEKWRQQQDLIALLELPGIRDLASGLGVEVDGLTTQQREVGEGTAAMLLAATLFGPFGWTITTRQLKMTDHIEAVRLWNQSHEDAAVDEFLTRAWADGDGVWFRGSFGPLTTLAGRHEATLDLLLERNRLMHRALDHHRAGEYEASTMLVLSQVDGLTLDFTEGKFGFFWKGSPQDFIDEATVVGMPDFLARVFLAVNQPDNTTSLSTAFRRKPIMHGRYLAFGTETNSTKAFALMAGVLEWLKPRAVVLTERWQAEHEAKWAGSKERVPRAASMTSAALSRRASRSDGWAFASRASTAITGATTRTCPPCSPSRASAGCSVVTRRHLRSRPTGSHGGRGARATRAWCSASAPETARR
jgi:hypothetical protein